MTLSLFFAWLTVFLAIVTVLKYVARISKSVKANRFFHKIHIPAGVLMVLTGLLHGLFAGNNADTKLSKAHMGSELFSLNWGSICFVVSVLLGLSYLARKGLKKHWMKVHRILTVCLLVFLVLHVADVGIQLPKRMMTGKTDSGHRKEQMKNEVNNLVTFSDAQLKDGVYEGSAEGYKDTIKVSVTVEKGVVTNIEIIDENDTPKFFKRAIKIVDDIISKQSLDVDAVSGATYSSVGIINAVKNALYPH